MSTFPFYSTKTARRRDGNSGTYNFRLGVEITSQSITNNTSTITLSLGLAYSLSSSGRRWNYGQNIPRFTLYYSLDNEKWTSAYTTSVPTYTSNGEGSESFIEMGSVSVTLPHNNDGTKTIYTKMEWVTGGHSLKYDPVSTTIESGLLDLPTIPRASTFVLDKTSATYGDAIKITITRASTSFTHTIQLSCNGDDWTNIATDVATTTTYTIPTSIATRLIASTNTIRFRVLTFNDTTQIGSTIGNDVTISTPESFTPTLSFNVSDLSAHTSVFGGYVNGKSEIKVEAVASLKYGATLSTFTLSNGTATSSGTTTTLSQTYIVDGSTYTANVKDSRSQTTSATTTPTVYAYAVPSISNITIHRTDSNATENDEGAYITATFDYSIANVNNKNTRSVQVKYKANDQENYSSIELATSSYFGTLTTTFAASTENTYEVVIEVTDYFNTATYIQNISTAFTLIDYGANGKSVAFGKVSTNEDNVMEIADDWTLKVKKILLNGIDVEENLGGGGGTVTVDDTLSTTSTNPVQNKVITTVLNQKASKSEIPTTSPLIISLTNVLIQQGNILAGTIDKTDDEIESAFTSGRKCLISYNGQYHEFIGKGTDDTVKWLTMQYLGQAIDPVWYGNIVDIDGVDQMASVLGRYVVGSGYFIYYTVDLKKIAHTGNYINIEGTPTNLSAFTNDVGYLTEHQSLANYSTTSQVQTMINEAIGSIENGTY